MPAIRGVYVFMWVEEVCSSCLEERNEEDNGGRIVIRGDGIEYIRVTDIYLDHSFVKRANLIVRGFFSRVSYRMHCSAAKGLRSSHTARPRTTLW